ncbi:MAG: iron-containing alcohol dehydrogenase family protein [Desemzia incerta]
MALVVRTGPQEYECREGVLKTLTEKLKARTIHQVILVHGTASWQKALPYLTPLLESGIEVKQVEFEGDCTYEEVERLSSIAEQFEADAIIGVGGGKIMDAVKYASAKTAGVESVLVPTLASNCAPWTPLSVMYSADGVCLGFDMHTKQVGLLVVEPALLLDSPVNYFIAGIADTLAKWYESDKILSQPEHQANAFLLMARSAALHCKVNISQYGRQAVKAIESQTLTTAFVQVCETIISISGLVGGFGDSYARTTIGHAVHDKITVFPETHAFLHGEKVAYGILVQLAVEEKWTEVDELLAFYDELHLPKSLIDLKLDHLSIEQIAAFSTEVAADENLLESAYVVSNQAIQEAISALETYVTQTIN